LKTATLYSHRESTPIIGQNAKGAMMARVDVIRRAVLDLVYDLDNLSGRVAGASDVPADAAQRILDAAQQARAHLTQQIAQNAGDFDFEPLLDWINHVRSNLDRAATDIAQRPRQVSDYVERLRLWSASLPGDRTTPPP
jgi:hypothetical protein